MHTCKQIVKFLLVMLLALSCKEKHDKITIGILDGPSAVSFIQLIDNPPLIQGKQVEFIIKTEALQIQALMMQNKLDFAILPTIMAANLYNKGVDYQVLGIPIWGSLYLLSNDLPMKRFEAYDKQKIHVFGQGATADIWMQYWLQQKQLEQFELDYTYSSNAELARALLLKQINLAVLSEPLVSVVLDKDKDIYSLTNLNNEWLDNTNNTNTFAQTSFLVKNYQSEDYRLIINEVVAAYKQACDFTYQHPDEAAFLLYKHQIYPTEDLAKASIPRCNILYKDAAAVQTIIWDYLSLFYEINPKSIGGKLPDISFVYQSTEPQ